MILYLFITADLLDETLSPEQQHVQKKMLLGHNKAWHPTSPEEVLEDPTALTTYNPTLMTLAASETKPSLTPLIITTVEMEAQLDTLLPGMCKPSAHVRTRICFSAKDQLSSFL